jgi:hypothetical protein
MIRKRALLSLSALLLLFTVSCSGCGLRYKEAKVGPRKVLVNRFSDKVTHFWNGKKWEALSPAARSTLQALYDAQRSAAQ